MVEELRDLLCLRRKLPLLLWRIKLERRWNTNKRKMHQLVLRNPLLLQLEQVNPNVHLLGAQSVALIVQLQSRQWIMRLLELQRARTRRNYKWMRKQLQLQPHSRSIHRFVMMKEYHYLQLQQV
jgi:hypothetical protein